MEDDGGYSLFTVEGLLTMTDNAPEAADFPFRRPGQPFPPSEYAQFRRQGGLVKARLVDGNPVWVVTRQADVRAVVHWAIPKSVEAYYQEVGRGGRDGLPAAAILLASRADLGRLINFIKGDAVEAGDVLAYVRRLRGSCGDQPTVIDAPRADRDRICLGIAERAGLCTLEPAPGGRLQVTLDPSAATGMGVVGVCKTGSPTMRMGTTAMVRQSSSRELSPGDDAGVVPAATGTHVTPGGRANTESEQVGRLAVCITA